MQNKKYIYSVLNLLPVLAAFPTISIKQNKISIIDSLIVF